MDVEVRWTLAACPELPDWLIVISPFEQFKFLVGYILWPHIVQNFEFTVICSPLLINMAQPI